MSISYREAHRAFYNGMTDTHPMEEGRRVLAVFTGHITQTAVGTFDAIVKKHELGGADVSRWHVTSERNARVPDRKNNAVLDRFATEFESKTPGLQFPSFGSPLARKAVALAQNLKASRYGLLCPDARFGLDKWRLKPEVLIRLKELTDTTAEAPADLGAARFHQVIKGVTEELKKATQGMLDGSITREAYLDALINNAEIKAAGVDWKVSDFDDPDKMDYNTSLHSFVGMTDGLFDFVKQEGMKEHMKWVYKVMNPFDSTDILYDFVAMRVLLCIDPRDWRQFEWSHTKAAVAAGGASKVDKAATALVDTPLAVGRRKTVMRELIRCLEIEERKGEAVAHPAFEDYEKLELTVDTEGDDLRAAAAAIRRLGRHKVSVTCMVPALDKVEEEAKRMAAKTGQGPSAIGTMLATYGQFLNKLSAEGYEVVYDDYAVNAAAVLRTAMSLK